MPIMPLSHGHDGGIFARNELVHAHPGGMSCPSWAYPVGSMGLLGAYHAPILRTGWGHLSGGMTSSPGQPEVIPSSSRVRHGQDEVIPTATCPHGVDDIPPSTAPDAPMVTVTLTATPTL